MCVCVFQVIPTYYATFTLSCIIAAAVVYREFEGLSFGKIVLFFIGLVTYTFAKTKKCRVGGMGYAGGFFIVLLASGSKSELRSAYLRTYATHALQVAERATA